MDEKQLINICKETIDSLDLDWYESNLFEDGLFEEILNEKLNADKIKYSVIEVESTNWENDGSGKYYTQYITYQLVQYNSEIEKYPTEESVSEAFNIFFGLPVTKSGSYFTEWFYEYENPRTMQKKIVHIPEQIIPAHDEERIEEI